MSRRGGVEALRTETASASDSYGKQLFISNCKSCHTLAAVQAKGVTGPNLDELGLDRERVLNAIENGGTGQGRMPAGLLEGEDAEAGRPLRRPRGRPVAHSATPAR